MRDEPNDRVEPLVNAAHESSRGVGRRRRGGESIQFKLDDYSVDRAESLSLSRSRSHRKTIYRTTRERRDGLTFCCFPKNSSLSFYDSVVPIVLGQDGPANNLFRRDTSSPPLRELVVSETIALTKEEGGLTCWIARTLARGAFECRALRSTRACARRGRSRE